mgnify:FL=1
MTPVIIYLILVTLGIYLCVSDKKVSNYNWKSALFAVFINLGLFCWAGFFKTIDVPQVLILGYQIVYFGFQVIKDGQPRSKPSFLLSLMVNIAYNAILLWGGFFNVLL